MQRVLKVIGGAVAAAAGIYGGYVALTYASLGRAPDTAEGNPLLDELMPEYEVRERHSARVAAPTEITLAAARDISFQDSPIARTIFALREFPARLLGAPPAPTERRPLIDEVIALGWREIAQTPGR